MSSVDNDRDSHDAPAPLLEQRPGAAERWKRVFSTRLWWVTAVCAVIAIALIVSAIGGNYTEIHVRFANGHGIKPGDALRYRGITVGEVSEVQLDADLSRLIVQIRLESLAAGLAREGSEFWIVRPQLSLSRVRGLETVVGANYIEVRPGPTDAPRLVEFEGLESPPTLSEGGTLEILIHFQDGRGLKTGDVVKHLGIEVGEVSSVSLTKEMDGVDVRVLLTAAPSTLARQGSQFWIERPSVSMVGVSGLDTVVSGRHIAVLPGPVDGQQLTVFDGLEDRPALQQRSPGGLEFILESSQRLGLTSGAPLKFRGIEIGRVTSLGLSGDAAHVEARVFVEPEYRRLIRTNTRFWTISGVDMRFGITGVQMEVDSLSSLAAGGVALATPEPVGKPVNTGHRFTLLDTSDDDALDRQARIPLGSRMLPGNVTLPKPLRTTLNFPGGWLRSTRHTDGWGLVLEGDQLLMLNDLPPTKESENKESGITLAVAGQEIEARVVAEISADLRLYDLSRLDQAGVDQWPRARIRAPDNLEDCLLVADPLTAPLPLTAARLQRTDEDWQIDRAVSLGPQWQGAFVVSRTDGALIGVVKLEKKRNVIRVLRDEHLNNRAR